MRSTVKIEVSLADLDVILSSLRFVETHNDHSNTEWLTHRLEAVAQFDFGSEALACLNS